MSTRRKSIGSHHRSSSHGRLSSASLYSTTGDLNDEEHRTRLARCRSLLSFHRIDLYHILERQEGTGTLAYHLFVFVLTLASLILGSISTIEAWRLTLDTPLYYGELGLWIFFAFELLLRIWSAGCLAQYRTYRGRIKFITRRVIVLDTLTLCFFASFLATGLRTGTFSKMILKVLRPFQMLRFVRVDRQLSSWRILKGIIVTHRQELTVTLVIAFMFLITGSYLVHIAETPMDPQQNSGMFRSMADTMWFSITTMTTIGFGDVFPITYIGKMITTTICLLGVAFWCLPAGIIGSGLAIKVQEQKRNEALSRLVPAAADVIRNWWRFRCAYKEDRFVSTWRIYTLIQRRVDPTDHESPPTFTASDHLRVPNAAVPSTKRSRHIRRTSIHHMTDLPRRYITAIKIIRMLKYSIACKKFQDAKRPIDIKDLVKENTKMNNRLSVMLNEVQRRLDFTLGTTRTASFLSDEEKRKTTLIARVENVETLADRLQSQLTQLEQLAIKLVKND